MSSFFFSFSKGNLRALPAGLLASLLLLIMQNSSAADVILAKDGQALSVIIAPAEALQAPPGNRLRESIADLSRCLSQISGSEIGVQTGMPPAGDLRLPILLGASAEAVFGKPNKPDFAGQGWRLVVSAKGIGMLGESEAAISYAIYELLDRLGCRWFMPGPLGEDIPSVPALNLPELDISDAPAIAGRGLLFDDADFSRRNRLAGVALLETATGRQARPLADATIPRCPAHSLFQTNCPARIEYAAIATALPKTNALLVLPDIGHNPGDPTAPLPLIRRWSEDLPLLLTNGIVIWQPELRHTFAGSLPGLYLACRLSWYPHTRPKDVLSELYARFYGSTAMQMREFWESLDQAWADTPDHSSGPWGHMRRFTPEIMAKAGRALDIATSTAQTPSEQARIAMAKIMFDAFEQFMRLHKNLAEAGSETLVSDAEACSKTWNDLVKTYSASQAFAPLELESAFQRFTLPACHEALNLLTNFNVLQPAINIWRCRVEEKEPGELLGWPGPYFQDADWPVFDSRIDTLSTLGVWNREATIWCRAKSLMPPVTNDAQTFLRLSALDGVAKVYVNGYPVPAVPTAGQTRTGALNPCSFNVSEAINPGQSNHFSIAITVQTPLSPGVGGLLGPACLYREK